MDAKQVCCILSVLEQNYADLVVPNNTNEAWTWLVSWERICVKLIPPSSVPLGTSVFF